MIVLSLVACMLGFNHWENVEDFILECNLASVPCVGESCSALTRPK